MRTQKQANLLTVPNNGNNSNNVVDTSLIKLRRKHLRSRSPSLSVIEDVATDRRNPPPTYQDHYRRQNTSKCAETSLNNIMNAKHTTNSQDDLVAIQSPYCSSSKTIPSISIDHPQIHQNTEDNDLLMPESDQRNLERIPSAQSLPDLNSPTLDELCPELSIEEGIFRLEKNSAPESYDQLQEKKTQSLDRENDLLRIPENTSYYEYSNLYNINDESNEKSINRTNYDKPRDVRKGSLSRQFSINNSDDNYQNVLHQNQTNSNYSTYQTDKGKDAPKVYFPSSQISKQLRKQQEATSITDESHPKQNQTSVALDKAKTTKELKSHYLDFLHVKQTVQTRVGGSGVKQPSNSSRNTKHNSNQSKLGTASIRHDSQSGNGSTSRYWMDQSEARSTGGCQASTSSGPAHSGGNTCPAKFCTKKNGERCY